MNDTAPRRGLRFLLGLALYGILLLPVVALLLHAFTTQWFYPQLLPKVWTITPLLRQVQNPITQAALVKSIEIAMTTSLLSLAIGYPAARTLATRHFRGRELITVLFFVPTVVPPVAMGMGLNILFLRLGLAGSLLGVILVHLVPVLPYMVFTMTGVFARYDLNYEHQAQVLGATPFRIFFTVTVPLVLPGIVVALLFAFLVSWSQYLLTFLIGGGQVTTLPLLLFSAVAGGNPTTISILSLLFIGPPLLVIAATARYLTAETTPTQQTQY